MTTSSPAKERVLKLTIYVLMTKRKKIDAPMFLIYVLPEKDNDLLAPGEVV